MTFLLDADRASRYDTRGCTGPVYDGPRQINFYFLAADHGAISCHCPVR